MTAPRVVAFIGDNELGRHALELVKDNLVEIVTDDAAGRALNLVDWLNPTHATAANVAQLKPTHGISAGYRHIIPKEIIDLFPGGIANVHTSLLPYGRGAHPNAWAIAEGHPAGVTIHLVDAGVDTGPIIAQRELPKRGHDTAATLQERLIALAKEMMADWVPRILAGVVEPKPQPKGGWKTGTHRKADLETLRLEWDDEWMTSSVIDLLRARTFHPYPGALYIAPDGKRYRIRIEIEPDTGC
jgi:methionyl-tRNA formyltransferase